MKAIVDIGGKQILLNEGQVFRTEKLDHEVGETFQTDKVLCIFDDDKTIVGTPLVAGAKVEMTVKSKARGKKIRIRTYKRRKASKRTLGHRQDFTELKVEKVIAG